MRSMAPCPDSTGERVAALLRRDDAAQCVPPRQNDAAVIDFYRRLEGRFGFLQFRTIR